MSPIFQIGDLVILQHASWYSEYDGTPGVVVGGLAPRAALDMHSMKKEFLGPSYRVRVLVADGFVVTALPHQLRRPSEAPLGAEEEEDRAHEAALTGSEGRGDDADGGSG